MPPLNVNEVEVAAAYDKGSQAYCDSWPQPHPWLDEERSRFVSLLPAAGKLLDIGCGPGHDSAFFHHKGFDTIGIDVSSEMVRRARSSHPECRFEILSGLQIEELKTSFDAIWAAYVILHVRRSEMPRFVDEIRQRLKRTGLLFFVTTIDDETVEEETDIAGLKDVNGENVFVYTVRWRVDELRELFGDGFEELWTRLDVPLPNERRTVSSIWRRI